jgi:hypothetical protein
MLVCRSAGAQVLGYVIGPMPMDRQFWPGAVVMIFATLVAAFITRPDSLMPLVTRLRGLRDHFLPVAAAAVRGSLQLLTLLALRVVALSLRANGRANGVASQRINVASASPRVINRFSHTEFAGLCRSGSIGAGSKIVEVTEAANHMMQAIVACAEGDGPLFAAEWLLGCRCSVV